jgi:hypothetical protein
LVIANHDGKAAQVAVRKYKLGLRLIVESAEVSEAWYAVFVQPARLESVSKLSMEVLDGAKGTPDGFLRKTLIFISSLLSV